MQSSPNKLLLSSTRLEASLSNRSFSMWHDKLFLTLRSLTKAGLIYKAAGSADEKKKPIISIGQE